MNKQSQELADALSETRREQVPFMMEIESGRSAMGGLGFGIHVGLKHGIAGRDVPPWRMMTILFGRREVRMYWRRGHEVTYNLGEAKAHPVESNEVMKRRTTFAPLGTVERGPRW